MTIIDITRDQVVYGFPGTGKTYSIERAFERKLNEVKGKPERQNILFISYTNTAVINLRERLGLSDKYVTTFHALAKRMIEAYRYCSGYKFEPNSFPIFCKLHNIPYSYDKFTRLPGNILEEKYQFFYYYSHIMDKKDIYSKLPEELKAYEDFKEDEKIIDFSDLLYYFYRLVIEEDIRYNHVFADEAQDLAPVQIETLCYMSDILTIVGDDAQAIYIPSDFYSLKDRLESYNIIQRCNRIPSNLIDLPKKYLEKFPDAVKKDVYAVKDGGNLYYGKVRIKELKNLCDKLDNVAVLCRTNRIVKMLNSVLRFKTIKYSKIIPDKVIDTIHACKGLEFDNVILINNTTEQQPTFMEWATWFVGISRMKTNLFILDVIGTEKIKIPSNKWFNLPRCLKMKKSENIKEDIEYIIDNLNKPYISNKELFREIFKSFVPVEI